VSVCERFNLKYYVKLVEYEYWRVSCRMRKIGDLINLREKDKCTLSSGEWAPNSEVGDDHYNAESVYVCVCVCVCVCAYL
jgi:hypothetical protein